MANGNIESVMGIALLPISLGGVTHKCPIRIAPGLMDVFVLGMDSAKRFGLVIHTRDEEIWMADEPYTKHHFGKLDEDEFEVCKGIALLSGEEKEELSNFLKKVLPPPREKLPAVKLVEHVIDTQGHSPIKQKNYRMSPKVHEALLGEIKKLLDNELIEPSASEWCNPVVMARKSDGTYRLCIDFRKVNEVSKKDAYPLPHMTDILDKLNSARYISTLDLNKAYHQIPLSEESKEKTAFIIPGKGLYQYKRMLFGLTGAPATFQRFMDKVITHEMKPHVFAYLDDIIIVSKTFEEHLYWLDKTIKRLCEAGLTLNPDKCDFCKLRVQYLGFVVNQHGLDVDEDKVKPIFEYPRPVRIKQLRRFIGMTSWYRRFIKDYARSVSH